MNRLAFLIIATIFSCGIFILTPTLQAQAPPGMVLIPGGEFEMGCHVPTPTCDSNELPLHDVYIDAFYIDVYEVTNQQYCDYLNSAYPDLIDVTGGVVYKKNDSEPYCDTYLADADSHIHWNGSNFTVMTGKEDHPMLEVSWYGAAAYANWRSEQDGRTPCYDLETWDNCPAPIKVPVWLEELPPDEGEMTFQRDECRPCGYRLPTEAEWEYAARGGLHSPYRRFPWGDDIGIYNIANYAESADPYESGANPKTTPVGFYNGELHYKEDFGWPGSQTSYQTSDGENGYGLYDMAGNVWEWCNDRYDMNYYSSSPYDNPQGPASGGYRVRRGGSWSYYIVDLRCANRYGSLPDTRIDYIGFRLALD